MITTARTSMAFCPCHITGFFQIHDRSKNPLKIGSIGAGVNLEHGVTTQVSIRRASHPKIFITLNRKPLNSPIVSKTVVEEYLKQQGRSWQVSVSHQCALPTGSGYGTSGAGALSLSLAINDAFEEPFNKLEASAIAHSAEVKCQTGLGTVTAAFTGGFIVRVKPGAPGIGQTQKLRVPKSLRVVSGSFGPIPTRKVLASRRLRDRVNLCGRTLVAKLLRQPERENFLELSRNFAECLALMTNRLRQTIRLMEKQGIASSMMMLGEAVFCMVDDDIAARAADLISGVGLSPVISHISSRGARLL